MPKQALFFTSMSDFFNMLVVLATNDGSSLFLCAFLGKMKAKHTH